MPLHLFLQSAIKSVPESNFFQPFEVQKTKKVSESALNFENEGRSRKKFAQGGAQNVDDFTLPNSINNHDKFAEKFESRLQIENGIIDNQVEHQIKQAP